MAILIQYYEQKLNVSLYYVKDVKKEIISERIKKDELKQLLVMGYECTSKEKASLIYKKVIESEVDNIIKGILDNDNLSLKTSDVISKYSRYKKRPMTSLRDTEEQIEISLKK